MASLEKLIARAEAVLARLEKVLPQPVEQVNWDTPAIAFGWRKRLNQAYLQPIHQTAPIHLDDLLYINRQKTLLEQNTRQFLLGLPANNALLTGARGTGKSSLIRACLHKFSSEGLRLIEVDKNDLGDLFDISEWIISRPEKFILYCDDLSFDEGDSSYKALKVALDGSVAAQPDNMLIYATSNRRYLMPEKISDNKTYTRGDDGELHPGETVEEKISFSDRFGLWLSFYSFSQDEYLEIAAHWLRYFGCDTKEITDAKQEALQWAMHRGSRSGRIALHFARDYAGRMKS